MHRPVLFDCWDLFPKDIIKVVAVASGGAFGPIVCLLYGTRVEHAIVVPKLAVVLSIAFDPESRYYSMFLLNREEEGWALSVKDAAELCLWVGVSFCAGRLWRSCVLDLLSPIIVVGRTSGVRLWFCVGLVCVRSLLLRSIVSVRRSCSSLAVAASAVRGL